MKMEISQVVVVIALALSFYATQAAYSPPLNTPNDCPIQCVTAPCPCGTYCEDLSCPVNCSVWKRNERNCHTCECDCPQRKCWPCAYGYVTDQYGCQTCHCTECPLGDQPCNAVRCPSGTVPTTITSEVGCPTCECVPRAKPGVCPKPKPDHIGICLAECSNDSKCPGEQKCCGNCPKKCVDPVAECLPKRCDSECPYGYSTDLFGCQTCDCQECPLGDQPCIAAICPQGTIPTTKIPANGCPQCDCVPKTKPGACPKPKQRWVFSCSEGCSQDSDCSGKQKCCGGCPRECVDPVNKAKPGRCPRLRRNPLKGCTAEPQCEDDSSCPGKLKCCGGCPRKCRRARKRRGHRAGCKRGRGCNHQSGTKQE